MDQAELVVADAAAWRSWLAIHHGTSPGVWLVLAKKGTVEPTTLSYDQALDEALCQGWIDGQLGRRDDRTFKRRFSPRTSKSIWSARNTTHIERLAAQGRLQPAGEAEVARALADGRWDAAYAGQADMGVPDDLVAALATRPEAAALFENLNSANRYAILFRIAQAKTAARANQITRLVDQLARGETIHPQRSRITAAAKKKRPPST
jgi:uncharacterized protein YdeI (YjbR/CyaY-like superfamily)